MTIFSSRGEPVLVGTSDGTVDLVLNCTALNFLLCVDNVMGENFALFSRKAFGMRGDTDDFVEGVASHEQLRSLCRLVKLEPQTQKHFTLGVWINFLAVFVVQIVCVCLMQAKTSAGDAFEFTEKGPGAGLGVEAGANVITKTMRGGLIVLMLVFTLTDTVIIGPVLSHGRDLKTRVGVAAANFALEFAALYVGYTWLHQHLIIEIIMGWRDAGKLKDCYDTYGDDCKYRARGYSGMAPN